MPANPDPALRQSLPRGGFTLFEVAVSAALVSGCLISVLLVFPIGLRAQQQARFQVYAGVKVLEMVDTFANSDHTWPSHELEAEENGESLMPRQWPTDLDRMMMTPSLGLLPLPDSIARRLDSDGDEIAKILDGGAHLYYASPAAYDVGYHAHSGGRNIFQLAKDRALPPESQSVLFAVVGDAQLNALPGHPCITTYFAHYPSMASTGRGSASGTGVNRTIDGGLGDLEGAFEYPMWMNDYAYFGSNANAADHFDKMAKQCPSWRFTWYPTYDPNGWDDRVDHEAMCYPIRVTTYISEAQELLKALGVTLHGTPPYLLPDPPADLTTKQKPWDRNDPDIYPSPAFIGGLRFLAAGALARTGWHQQNGAWCPGQGFNVGPWFNFNIAANPTTQADTDYCKDLHDLCMRWTRRYAATNPYDWGAFRPLNRPSCYDFPLLEYDLFAPYQCTKPALKGDLANPSAPDVTWKITAPVKPTNYVRAYTPPAGGLNSNNHAFIDASWTTQDGSGNLQHCNLAAPFAAAERCRDIVCWAVDWKAYEDYESAPSSPWDASMCFVDSKGALADSELNQYPPDLCLAWADSSRTSIAGVPVNWDVDPNSGRHTSVAYRQSWFGLWGIDRDGNGKFDKGPLPTSARLRAVPIGRWHYYDRRLISALRN